MSRWKKQARWLNIACMAAGVGILLFGVLQHGHGWLQHATAPAPRSHPVLRISVPGYDIGADAIPARAGEPGYVEFWLGIADSDDYYRPVIRVFGAPALPMPPRPQPLLPRPQPTQPTQPLEEFRI